MGVAAAVVTALALAATPVAFVQAHGSNGAYAETGGTADPLLTAWAVLGLRAVGADAPGSLDYLRAHEQTLTQSTDVSLVALAEEALGYRNPQLLSKLVIKPSGEIGPTLNSTYWAVLARGGAPLATARFIVRHQAKSGGFAWAVGGQPDSNDTAAALEALRVLHARGPAIAKAVRFLRGFENEDGGFELTHGRGSDAQSTAWAIQGFVAAGVKPPRAAFAYLARMKQADGSYRYSAKYTATPVWVTSQVLAALAKKPFPLT